MRGTPAQRLRDIGAIVTGAASGIGAATAEAFDREGATTLLVDVDEPPLRALAARLGDDATAYVVDLGSDDAVETI
ncbi:MAG: SDR family NAD(P)-dependent oxidoreductase, partial [Actinomycetota bacterium]